MDRFASGDSDFGTSIGDSSDVVAFGIEGSGSIEPLAIAATQMAETNANVTPKIIFLMILPPSGLPTCENATR
jgi:hypothetical protein